MRPAFIIPIGLACLLPPAPAGAAIDPESVNLAISPDGRYVAFASRATNLVSGDTNGIADIFVRDLQVVLHHFPDELFQLLIVYHILPKI